MEQFNDEVSELYVLTQLARDIEQDVVPDDLLDDWNPPVPSNDTDAEGTSCVLSLLCNKYIFDTIESRQNFMSDFMSVAGKSSKGSNMMFLSLLKMLERLGHLSEDTKKQILIVYNSYDSKNEKLTTFRNLILSFPWSIFKKVNKDTVSIENRLNSRLYGMHVAKEKVIEHLVLHAHSVKPVLDPLLLHGPPGVGKTSFAMAIADAIGLPLIKISLAGVHDVAAFSGSSIHWSSSGPGLLIKEFIAAGCLNPVVLVDEVDKCGGSSAGRVTDILAELLNPEQSRSFKDLFLSVPVDLSNALYVCTANNIDIIPGYIKDRCETIFIHGYSSSEKKEIVKKYMAKQIVQKYKFNFDITIDDSAVETLSKVESLRQVKRIVRSGIARRLMKNGNGNVTVGSEDIMHELINPKWFEEV